MRESVLQSRYRIVPFLPFSFLGELHQSAHALQPIESAHLNFIYICTTLAVLVHK
jgi:hypothetical protein